MRDGEPFQFGVFMREAPRFLNGWRQGPQSAQWDRHYLVAPGTGIRIIGGERIEVTRRGDGRRHGQGFGTETVLLNAAFPLDWMALTLLERQLGRHVRKGEIDGDSAQSLVDSLAIDDLVQASVLKRSRTAFHGTIIATTTALSVPDWNASAIGVMFEAANPDALRALLNAVGFGNRQHRDLDDWLRQAYRDRRPAVPAERRAHAA
ncbi:hypothetical protein L1787_22040 [Acuticoccus sp. M5D2P5]|uniref:hypothetical protein n=1 Tax=Acuticoccus kalidii TaxID=2910977 RepID=UPI001F405D47|nr:hypothetical protein [Acuticoccus kalidii]MCF3936075.1 hypothetical protein [Acuticoccus kalidii]